MSGKLINVGIADIGIAADQEILRTILGSCVGICLYDSKNRIGGLSHIMLPTQKTKKSSPLKYADSAIDIMLDDMIDRGAVKRNITAKIVGGATMFSLSNNSRMGEIGKRNIVKVEEHLQTLKIKIIAKDVGGDCGRTIDFYMESGEVRVKSLNKELRIL